MKKVAYGPEEAIRECSKSPIYIAIVRYLVDNQATGATAEQISIALSRGRWSSNGIAVTMNKINSLLYPYGWAITKRKYRGHKLPFNLTIIKPKEPDNGN